MTKSTADDLYRTDYYAWALQQAEALREIERRRINMPLDIANLAEEVEDLAMSERDAVRSQIRRAIEHLLKLEYSRAAEPRADWQATVSDARNTLFDKLTASLRRDVDAHLAELYRQGRRQAFYGLRRFGERDAADALPPECPYALDDICRDDWYPANRHGISD